MRHHLVSLVALFITLGFINQSFAASIAVERSEAIEYNAVVAKAFAVDLRSKIKAVGRYSFVNSSSWLQLTEEGILFGTPLEANLGEHKLFVSIKKADVETLVRLVVHVANASPVPTFSFNAKEGEIFKMDLAAKTGIKGTYTYTNLPKWLEGMENGILVGVPEAADVGAFDFEFKVNGLEKGMSSKATIMVAPESTPPENAFVAKVGTFAAINLHALTAVKGRAVLVWAPTWLSLDTNGILSGTPTEADRGESYVEFQIKAGNGAYGFRFKTFVE